MAMLPSISSSLLCLLLYLFSLTVVAQQPLYYTCDSSSNFTANSTYQSNLNLLLSTFAFDASASGTGFNKTTVGKSTDQVHGLLLCRGDVNATECRNCLNAARSDVLEHCPYNKGAAIWYDFCFLRFSDQPQFLNSADNSLEIFMWNVVNVTQYFAANIRNGSSVSSVSNSPPNSTRLPSITDPSF